MSGSFAAKTLLDRQLQGQAAGLAATAGSDYDRRA
jgi:hypothetical protein